MPLESVFFRNDAKLEAAAALDSAHIVPGAAGDHVQKIQRALVLLDGATLTIDGSYGPATAAAVLEYKRKRNIINFSYQTKADNIVGRMTMAALDLEMLAFEQKPVFLQPLHPQSRLAVSRSQNRPLLAFSITGANLKITDLKPVPVRPPSSPGPSVPQEEVIIAVGTIGTMKVIGGSGGVAERSQLIHFYGQSKNERQVAALRGAKATNKNFEEIDILTDDITLTFDALNCGETFFQARVSPPQPPQKLSTIMRLLSMSDKAAAVKPPPGDYSVETNLKSGLVSKQGTPLNPLPGRRINIFGEGESQGFEDYSADIDFCSHSYSNGNGPAPNATGHRPWTADPRHPPGISSKSVNNICTRGSPMHQVTIDEIRRIAAGGCRFTYAEANGRSQTDILRSALAGVKVVDEGKWGNPATGTAIVFEFA